MPPKQQVQTAALPLSGVPQEEQIAVPSSAPAIQAPIDPGLLQEQAIARQQSLQQEARARYPETDTASIIATLAGLGGNLVGALTGQGAVGQSALEFGQRLAQQQRQEQDQFVSLVNQEEDRIRQEEKILTDLQNRKLQAESLVPQVERIPDPALQSFLYTTIARGDLDTALSALDKYESRKLQRERAEIDRGYKAGLSERAEARLGLAMERGQADLELRQLRKEKLRLDLELLPQKEQQRIFERERREYKKETELPFRTASALTEIYEILGDIETPAAQRKIAAVVGARGFFGSKFPRLAVGNEQISREDARRLDQALGRLFTEEIRQTGGKAITETEGGYTTSYTAYKPGKGFNNFFQTPDKVITGIRGIQRWVEDSYGRAESGLQEGTLKVLQDTSRGAPTTLRSFVEQREALKRLGGNVSLGKAPPQVPAATWGRMNNTTRIKTLLYIKGLLKE